MADLATVQNVIDRWRPLSAEETTLAGALVGDASNIIRRRWPDIDTRIASDAELTLTAKRVVAGMVRRAMVNRDNEGVVQQTLTTGPFAQGATFANPNNNLYLSQADILDLDPIGHVKPRGRNGWLA